MGLAKPFPASAKFSLATEKQNTGCLETRLFTGGYMAWGIIAPGLHVGFTPRWVSMAGRGRAQAHPPQTPVSLKENPMKRLITVMLLAMFSMGTLTACNTVAGAGKDIEKAGDKIEDKAEDCKDGKC